MPISSIGSYDPTTAAFDVNWEEANLELAPGAITLAGNYARADFGAERTQVLAAIARVPALAGEARFATADRDNARAALMARAKQFRGAVMSKVADKTYRDNLPAIPRLSADLSKFCEPLHTMTAMWERINAHAAQLGLTEPLTLQNNYDVAAFAADIEALTVLTNASSRAENAVGFARATRDNGMAAIYERLKQYRAAAPADLPADSPALMKLPRLSPEPGNTPPALGASGAWDAATSSAMLSWAASKAKDVERIQVRGCTGTYKDAEEEVVADLPADATSWSGDWGLTAPGAIASFKAFVMTESGHENGGKAVKIVRPAVG